MVDHKEPIGGDGGAGANQKERHPDYPNRTRDGKYGPGNSRDGKAEERIALDREEAKTGIPIERRQVKATHPDATQSRFYDGLEPTGVPGEYVGVEAKGDKVGLTKSQADFDARVSPQRPATAILDGQEIKIVETKVVQPGLGATPAEPAPLEPSTPAGGRGPVVEPAPVEASPPVRGPVVEPAPEPPPPRPWLRPPEVRPGPLVPWMPHPSGGGGWKKEDY